MRTTRGLTWLRNILIAVGVGILCLTLAQNIGFDLIPDIPHPEQHTVDRSEDPILLQLAGIQEFHGARGTFSVIVDLEKDTTYVPSFILGTKATMTATGQIDAYVSFGDAIITSDATQVTILLPVPKLGPVALDQTKTKVVARERGLLDRVIGAFVSSPVNDQALYVAAVKKIGDAAIETDLAGMAQQTTRNMIAALVAPRTANVSFGDVPPVYGPPAPTTTTTVATKLLTQRK